MCRGYLSNAVLGGQLSSNFVALSNRRVYYSGTFIARVGKTIRKSTGQIVIPLEKVTSISFLETKNVGLLALAVILLIESLFIRSAWGDISRTVSIFSTFGLLGSIAFFLAYFVTIYRFFAISSDSATIQVSYRLYGEDAIRRFAHDLGKALTKFRDKELVRCE